MFYIYSTIQGLTGCTDTRRMTCCKTGSHNTDGCKSSLVCRYHSSCAIQVSDIFRLQGTQRNIKIAAFLYFQIGCHLIDILVDLWLPAAAGHTVIPLSSGKHIIHGDSLFSNQFSGLTEPECRSYHSQLCMLHTRHFCPDDAQNIPTGEECPVADTPMDFRVPKPISRDLDADYEPLHLQGGYDHNFEVFCNPCATLTDPESGRSMSVYTDCPGVQLYSGNYLDQTGKGGIHYGKHSGIALETQFYPDALNKPQWKKPIVPAGKRYVSETVYRFSWR